MRKLIFSRTIDALLVPAEEKENVITLLVGTRTNPDHLIPIPIIEEGSGTMSKMEPYDIFGYEAMTFGDISIGT
jgi:hypothetical protein